MIDSHRPSVILGIALAIVSFAIALSVPSWADNLLLRTLTDFLKVAALACAWNLIGGFTGYASFGNVAFFGLGAYATGVAMVQFQLPFALGLLASVGVALLFSLFLGLPALRLRGHYFAIATLGAAEATREIVRNLEIAGANSGLVLPLERNASLFYFSVLTVLAVTLIVAFWIARTRFGYSLLAIREDEEAAAVCGIHTTGFKLAAFALSAVITGLIGGIHAYQLTYIDPEGTFDVKWTVQMIVMSVLGGAGTVWGPLLGAILVFWPAEYLSRLSTGSPAAPLIVFGSVIVLGAILLPRGLMDLRSRRTRLEILHYLHSFLRILGAMLRALRV
ncbi:branched-chain amino acid ABC transporter permease [Candidatus Acetothermia bacterium]|nr:branched-chain amino acid ABC transporter permease [Candidatus Acetothermia bacterium]